MLELIALLSNIHLWATFVLIWTRRRYVVSRPVAFILVPLLLVLVPFGLAAAFPSALMILFPYPVATISLWHWGRQNLGLWARFLGPIGPRARLLSNLAFLPGMLLFAIAQLSLSNAWLPVAAIAGLALSLTIPSFFIAAYFWLLLLPSPWAAIALSFHVVSYVLLVVSESRWLWLLGLGAVGLLTSRAMSTMAPGTLGAAIVAINALHFYYDSFLWKREARLTPLPATGTLRA